MRILKTLTFLMATFFMVAPVFAQDNDIKSLPEKELWKRAEAYVMVNAFDEALQYYLVLFDKDNLNRHVAFKAGYCYLQSEKIQDVNVAISYLNIASTGISKSFKNSPKEKDAPVETNYFLGVAYRLKKDYKTALDYYKDFQKEFESAKMNIVTQSQLDLEIKSCNEASKEKNVSEMLPYTFMIKNKPANMYVRCPIYAEEAGILFFTMGSENSFPPDINYDREYDFRPFDSIYYSKRLNDSIWDEPVNISKMIQVTSPILPVTATPDASKIFFVIDVGDNGDIYMSEMTDGNVSVPKALNRNINTRHWESFASITSDGKRLYFNSLRPGGSGGLDLYYSDLDENDKWGEAVNLGPAINTTGYEEMPYISRDGKELYFSSEGHSTTGGFDVFYVAYLQGDNKWTTPINVGFPFNTDGNDMGYFVEFEGDFSFCPVNSSKRRYGYEECDCISLKRTKSYKPIIVNCLVVPDKTLKSLPDDVMLFVVNDATGDTVHAFHISEVQKNASFTLPEGDYTLTTRSEYADPGTKKLNVPKESENISVIIPISAELLAQNPDRKNNPYLVMGAPITYKVLRDNTLSAMPNDLMLYAFNDETKEMVFSTKVTDGNSSNTILLPVGKYTFKTESASANPAIEKLNVPNDKDPQNVTLVISAFSAQVLTVTWVQFDFDKSNVKPEFFNTLDSLSDYMKRFPNSVVAVHGHTDPFGTNDYNLALGQRRATAVKTYLVNKGVDSNRLPTETYGEEKRIAVGDSAEARKYDRRVEFIVQKQGAITLKVIPRNPPKSLSK